MPDDDDDSLLVACLCAAWCTTCDAYRPLLAALAAARPALRFAWIDIEDDADALGDDALDIETFPTVMVLRAPGHTPGHSILLVRLKEMGAVILSGDAVHFLENFAGEGVPGFNFDRAQTLASIQRIKQIEKNLKATVIIQHDPRDIGKLPAFPAVAK